MENRGLPVGGEAASREGSDAPVDVLSAATVGEALARAREAAGMDIDAVAEHTKIRPSVLRHIEADEHDELPALTYSLGFVKAFARTVGLDPAETAERYRRESHKGDPVPTMVGMEPLDEQRRPSRALVWWSAVVVVFALLGLWAWGAGWLTPPPPEQPVGEEAAATVPEPLSEPVEAEQAVQPNAPVSLKATKEVWLSVTDSSNNARFFMGTLQPGEVLSLPPGRPWVLRTGRAGALEATVGSRTLPALGKEAENLRNFSLQPEDLLGLAGAQATVPAAPATR